VMAAQLSGAHRRDYTGSGIGKRRTVSLGIGQIAADKAAEQPTSETVSSREYPLMTLVNCTLIAWRPDGLPDVAQVAGPVDEHQPRSGKTGSPEGA